MEQVINLEEKRKDLSDLLHNHICEVTFTKINGEQRVMPCTLKEGVAPVIVRKEGTESKKQSIDTMSVYCMDKKEWRSFRVANVTQVKVIE